MKRDGWLDDAQMSVIVRTIVLGLLERHLVVTKDMKNDVAQKFLSCTMFLFRVLMGKYRTERGRYGITMATADPR